MGYLQRIIGGLWLLVTIQNIQRQISQYVDVIIFKHVLQLLILQLAICTTETFASTKLGPGRRVIINEYGVSDFRKFYFE